MAGREGSREGKIDSEGREQGQCMRTLALSSELLFSGCSPSPCKVWTASSLKA